MRRPTLALTALALGLPLAQAAAAQTPPAIDPATREASCAALTGGTVNDYDRVPFAKIPEAGSLAQWPAAPAGLLPARVVLRSEAETFNGRYQFAVRAGEIYAAPRSGRAPGWRKLPLPDCFAGRVESISADDDELIAVDADRRVFTMDNALKGPDLFNWTKRWGPLFWAGPGRKLPERVLTWSWSVLSPAEDRTWTDEAGNRHGVGAHKVSHIWALRDGGRQLTWMDPWLPDDDSYEMCGPHRGRFRSANLSASGSTVFVIGREGDLFTRLFDFDLSGSDPVFFDYSYERQRRGDPRAAIQLPSAGWVRHPKVPGAITSAISVEKTGVGAIHRILRVEGLDARGRTGYWEKDVIERSASAWRFHRTGLPLQGRRLRNPQRDTSARRLAPSGDLRFAGRAGGLRIEVADFNVACTPSRLILRGTGGRAVALRLHTMDGLRLQPRAAGLDATPREQYGAIEVPPRVLARLREQPPAVRALLRGALRGRRFTEVRVNVTDRALDVAELRWRLTR